jgi:hypothetical protein
VRWGRGVAHLESHIVQMQVDRTPGVRHVHGTPGVP